MEIAVLPPPVLEYAVREGETVSVPLFDHLPPGLVYSLSASPVHGTVEGEGAVRIFRPTLGFGGEETFTFLIEDPESGVQTPVDIKVNVERTTGLLALTSSHPEAGWRVAGEEDYNTGPSTERYLTAGEHLVEFKPIDGFETPPSQTFVIEVGGEVRAEIVYEMLLDPYLIWLEDVFTVEQLANPAVSGEDADFDGDRFSTFAEWALNLNPTRHDVVPVTSWSEPGTVPAVRLVDREGEKVLQITYLRRLDHEERGLTYEGSFSGDLIEWKTGTIVIVEPLDETWESIRVESEAFGAESGMLFTRLTVRRTLPLDGN